MIRLQFNQVLYKVALSSKGVMMNDDVTTFINAIDNKTKREDSIILCALLTKCSGYSASLQGNIIGFGRYHYQYESGREGDCAVIGFSPRKQHLAIYIMPGFAHYQQQLARLGKHKTGKSCLYIKKLADVELSVLEDISRNSVNEMQRLYRCSDC